MADQQGREDYLSGQVLALTSILKLLIVAVSNIRHFSGNEMLSEFANQLDLMKNDVSEFVSDSTVGVRPRRNEGFNSVIDDTRTYLTERLPKSG